MVANSITRGWRITIIVITGFVILLIAAFLFLDTYLTPKLSAKLKNAVLTGSDSLYHIDFSKAELHIWQGKAILNDVRLIPDTAVYHRLRRQGNAPAEVYELEVKRLLITGAHPLKFYFKKQLDIDQINLDQPQVRVSSYPVKKDSPGKPGETIYAKLAPALKSVHVGAINLRNITATYLNQTKPQTESYRLKEMNLAATELLIDSATQTDPSRTLFCRDIVTDLHRFSWQTADGLYLSKVDSVRLSTRTARLVLSGIRIQPIAAAAFFARDKKERDRYALRLNSVVLNNFDYQSFRKQQELNVARLVINKGDLEIYSNPRGRPKKTDRLVTYPNYVISHLQTVLQIDTLDVKHIDVVLTMVNKKTRKPGAISFVNTTGRLLNITNKAARIKLKPNTSVDLSTYLLGKGKLDFGFVFRLNDPAYHYRYHGHLGPMNLLAGNSVLVPLALIKVRSGSLKSLDFSIRSDAKTSAGKVTFLYNDLKIELLRAGQEGYQKKGLLSFLANLIVIKNNNPDDAGTPPRSSGVVYVRPPLIPFFASVWQTILSGVKPAVGVGKAEPADSKKKPRKAR